jgi:hypothetical protein
MGIIHFMSPKFIRLTLCLSLLFQLSGLLAPGFISKANALWWEDDSPLSDPKEKINRPSGFFLSDWINGLDKESKKAQYKDLENQDHGPSVNNGQKGIIIIASGLVGLGAGLVTAYALTNDPSQQTRNLFIGGAIGLCAGIGIGALIMPRDYEVQESQATLSNRWASLQDVRFRQAFAQDPVRMKTQKAFEPTYSVVSVKF